jgi:hypothetical protein
MGDGLLTRDEAHTALERALKQCSDLRADKLLWGNRQAPWSVADRAYRLDPQLHRLGDNCRHRPGSVTRVVEEIVLHLCHRVCADQQRTERQVGRDLEQVRGRLLTDSALRLTGLRVSLGEYVSALADSGDSLETDLPIRLEYGTTLSEVT